MDFRAPILILFIVISPLIISPYQLSDCILLAIVSLLSDHVSRKGFEKMKTEKSIPAVYEDSPLDQRALNGTQCQDNARTTRGEQHADPLKLRAHHLVSEVHRLLQRGATKQASYFDTIAQRELMKSIAWHVNDAAMLALIEAWLEVYIEASDGSGRKRVSLNHC
jgi:hypothetical protein